MNPETLFAISAVSQATFALTLAILAWGDRRSRGLLWLSMASGLYLFVNTVAQLWQRYSSMSLGMLGLAGMVTLFFCVFKGMQQLLEAGTGRERRDILLLCVSLGFVLLLCLVDGPASLIVARIVAMIWVLRTIHLLLRTTVVSLKPMARVSGVMLGLTLAGMSIRLLVRPGQLPASNSRQLGIYLALLVISWFTMMSFIGLYMAVAQHRLHVETRIDPLTGLQNRRSMEEMAEREIQWAQQHDWPLSLLMIDIDHFKQVNDTWGHALGDRALQQIGETLRRNTRAGGLVARMGGEEFAVLLPNTSKETLPTVGERLRFAVESLSLAETDIPIRLTVSVGAAVLQAGETSWTGMMRRADLAMYRAKREGRNRVFLAHQDESMQTVPQARTSRALPYGIYELGKRSSVAPNGSNQGTAQDPTGSR